MSKAQERSTMQRIGDNFRTVAGLPDRKNQKPIVDQKGVSEATVHTEPEGGYGGKGGIKNTGAINATEERLSVGKQKAAKKKAESK